jgi:hypothetical protein
MADQATLFVATLDTPNFRFMSAGETEEGARAIMRRAWEVHAAQFDAAWTYDELDDDVKVVQLTAGTAVRDGSPITL